MFKSDLYFLFSSPFFYILCPPVLLLGIEKFFLMNVQEFVPDICCTYYFSIFSLYRMVFLCFAEFSWLLCKQIYQSFLMASVSSVMLGKAFPCWYYFKQNFLMLYSYTSMALFLYLDLCLPGIYVPTKCKVGIQFFFL